MAIEDALILRASGLGVDNFAVLELQTGTFWTEFASLELTTGPFSQRRHTPAMGFGLVQGSF
jgi:hypothetical protein